MFALQLNVQLFQSPNEKNLLEEFCQLPIVHYITWIFQTTYSNRSFLISMLKIYILLVGTF